MFSFRGPPLRSPSPDDLALVSFSRDLAASRIGSQSPIEDIRTFVERAEHVLGELVRDAKHGCFPYSVDPFKPLRSYFVCGPANDMLGYLLSDAGFPLRQAMTLKMGSNYPCSDHKFLALQYGDGITVDAAHHQFLKLLGAEREKLPRADVLVCPLPELRSHAESMAALASGDVLELFTSQGAGSHERRKLCLTQAELVDYFEHIWDFSRPHYQVSEHDPYKNNLQKFRLGDTSHIDPDQRSYLAAMKRRGLI